ncbi:cellulase family glycosylhydrolase [Amycolatopsis palatopharyngis]|uniref:cellulase family glycosylhydrolase n=1 Tax=Amycolatopsis palatopharyngis TaxID=187982 RepID=UPI0013BE9DC7|nr:cellulase family glycosylhydrolase [Amycolatopsis palatopharyngis]
MRGHRLRRLRLSCLVLLAVLLASTAGTATARPAPGDAAQPPVLQRDGRWLVDQHGRIVLLHGVNLVWKHEPYVPPDSPEGFTSADADWLAEHGFNGARIGTLWAGVTPDAPGVADENYLDRWDRIVDLLAERRIWLQFDFHQDQWHETYGGGGVPGWAVHRPLPFSLLPPVTAPFPFGYWTPELSTVYDRFWAGKDDLLAGWAAAWRVVAQRWRDQPYSMGYDLLNEPWAGLEWGDCLITGCAGTYSRELQPAFEQALAAVREADPDGLVWFEPQQFAGGQQVPTFFTPVEGEDQLGYSWHNYCPEVFLESQGLPGSDVSKCAEFSDERNRAALEQGERMHAAGLMSEFGATDDIEALAIDTAVADRHFTSWMHWAYKQWNDPTTADQAQGLFHDDADLGSGKPEKLRTLVRTYPQATAGTPLELTFDPGTGDFHYRYQPREAAAPTEIFVSPLHYPGGYDVTVAGGSTTGTAVGNRILVESDGTEPVTVTITGRG